MKKIFLFIMLSAVAMAMQASNELNEKQSAFRRELFSILGKEGYVSHVIGHIVDIHEQKLKEIELKLRADHDGLTGLMNKKATEELISRLLDKNRDAGVSLGKFIFVPRRAGGNAGRFLLEHEYGHTLQSLILGPFYLLVVGAPSMLWNRLPYFKSKRRRTGKSYYSAPFEKTANILAVHAHKHEQ